MTYPDLQTFREKSREGNLIPVWREILADMETPVSAFRKIAESENAYLLESVEKGENMGRYSILGCDPDVVFKCKGKEVQILFHENEEDFESQEDPIQVLQEYMTRYKPVIDSELPPFTGGAVGYLSYDMVRHWEKLPDSNPDDLCLPDAYFCITDTLIVFDHVKHKMILISNAHVHDDPEKAYLEALHKIDLLQERLRAPMPGGNDFAPKLARKNKNSESQIESNFTQKDFEEAVRKCQEYIFAGDIFQVVPSQRLKRQYDGKPLDLYRALRVINPSPYMYYLKLGDLRIIGSSPEILIKLEGKDVCVRPIAGTRKRGKTREEDLALEKDLLADPKERAEHIMLVDLGRNDVGRVSKFNTVRVDDLMVIERYSHVMHIVSNVVGELRDDLDAFDVLRAGFPAGTLTGAPKIRAMEIIDEVENVRRGPYGGAVGYISFNGDLDMAITIRTMVVKGNTIHMQAGAGVVADSVPEMEYEETLNKARAILKAADMAEDGLAL